MDPTRGEAKSQEEIQVAFADADFPPEAMGVLLKSSRAFVSQMDGA